MNSAHEDIELDIDGEEEGIWRRGQDHFHHFSKLLEQESMKPHSSLIEKALTATLRVGDKQWLRARLKTSAHSNFYQQILKLPLTYYF